MHQFILKKKSSICVYLFIYLFIHVFMYLLIHFLYIKPYQFIRRIHLTDTSGIHIQNQLVFNYSLLSFYNFPLTILVLSMVALAEADDPLVGTVSSVTLKEGSRGELICNYQRDALAVYWKKGHSSSTAVHVIILDLEYNKGQRSGPGYEDGRFNMTDNYTLVINDVMIKDEGRYFCEVSDDDLGKLIRNYTDVHVIGKFHE